MLPLNPADPSPVIFRTEKPILILISPGSVMKKRNVYNIHDLRIAAVLILPFPFRNLHVFAITDRSYPTRRLSIHNFHPRDASPGQFSRVGQAYDAFFNAHFDPLNTRRTQPDASPHRTRSLRRHRHYRSDDTNASASNVVPRFSLWRWMLTLGAPASRRHRRFRALRARAGETPALPGGPRPIRRIAMGQNENC